MGEIHGNFQLDAQYYNPDSAIGAPAVPEKMLMNGFSNINYNYGDKFMAGIRYESYLNVLQGFPPGYKGNGIPYRYASFRSENMQLSVGNFYEQFGSGLILRSYEERNLGYDNAFDGMRIKLEPVKGIYLKGLIGRQRLYFDYGPGIVRGFDGEIQLNDLIKSFSEKVTRISIGGSAVSKYQKDNDPTLRLPENVSAMGGRFNLIHKDFSLNGEYAYKINDPSSMNRFIYKPGEAIYLSGGYSVNGFGLSLSGKRIDNMDFRSDRSANLNELLINYLPALTRQHTYSLLAFYPYGTKATGELGFQAELFYRFPKNTKLGGPYGTTISINVSSANGLDTTRLNDAGTKLPLGYKATYNSLGQAYFRDVNVELARKFSKSFKMNLIYANQFYNKNVIEGVSGYTNVRANIGVLDATYKLTETRAIRLEAQHLSTKEDAGNWAYGGLEYTQGSNWFVAILDQYNYGNPASAKRFHYMLASIGYTRNAARISISYGKQRAGIFCVGGVCRIVPASNGLSISISNSF